ncbi:hypothetical protein ILYODFUR_033869 [Ilyodon furcidens]|uniref:Uncharacterized protein n=1 Tax=Ilyodon furcidens TaxID=33524 RepID=A0ABV0VA78_9TELE
MNTGFFQQRGTVEEIGPLERGVLLYSQWHHGSPLLPPPSSVAGSRLMQFILEVPGKSVLAFHVVTMAVGPNTLLGQIIIHKSLCKWSNFHQHGECSLSVTHQQCDKFRTFWFAML